MKRGNKKIEAGSNPVNVEKFILIPADSSRSIRLESEYLTQFIYESNLTYEIKGEYYNDEGYGTGYTLFGKLDIMPIEVSQ